MRMGIGGGCRKNDELVCCRISGDSARAESPRNPGGGKIDGTNPFSKNGGRRGLILGGMGGLGESIG